MEITKKQIDNDDGSFSLTEEQKIDHLIAALEENTKITKKVHLMLEKNNFETNFLYNDRKVQLTDWQQFKNFMMAVLANLVANVIDFKAIFGLNSKKETDLQQQLNNYKNGRR